MEFLRNDRFVLRQFTLEDTAAYADCRNDASTAEFQSWSFPYPLEKAERYVADFVAMDWRIEDLVDDKWHGLVVADPQTDRLIGDIGVRPEWDGRCAELGYNLAPAARGLGIATDASAWLIERLFNQVGVRRIQAALHPDNFASMMVLERLGFIYEGTARQAYWVDDVCTDDPRFGLLREDWESWNQRARRRPKSVELVEITPATRKTVFQLTSHKSQERFVAPMGWSAVDALVPDLDDLGGAIVPWMRAVVADGDIVGFVMMAQPTATNPHPFLWRLLIDRMHQRRGIGTNVLELLALHWKAAGAQQILVSWVPGRGSPEPLYVGFGFRPTGEVDEGEVVGSLHL